MSARPVARQALSGVEEPVACVLGNLDLVRPLGLAGIPCATVSRPGDPVRFSRFVHAAIDAERDSLVDRLLAFGRAQPEAPTLFYESDDDIELVSEHRTALAEAFRFLLPPVELVHDLLDKERFVELARRADLPVPRSQQLTPEADDPSEDLDLDFPLVLKPLPYRNHDWYRLVSFAKVLRVDSPVSLRVLWPRLVETRLRFLAQELIPGPEQRTESYHVYVDAAGRVAGEFTGRKIRTHPTEFGRSTALESTDMPDVTAIGREIVERLGLRGVAKLDFKRGLDGRLHLLEVNPRFSLWAHLGALAGVNLPALVHADLTGRPCPPSSRARAGVRWCWPRPDAAAARARGIPWHVWLRFALASEAKTNLSWDDPMPFLRGWVWPRASRRARGVVPSLKWR